MKKSKLLAVALIGLILAGGLALASCRAGCPGVGDCEIKDGKGSFCSKGGNTPSSNMCAASKAMAESYLGTKKSGKCDC